jgi:hypothetical protein
LVLLTASLISAGAETNLPAPPVAEPVAKSDHRTDAWRAWRLYRAGDYRGAADLWRQAADGAGGASGAAERQLRGTLLYNAACALYRDGAYREAAELFAAAGQTGTADADTLYNQGNAWWQAAADTSDGEDTDKPKLPSERIAELENAARAFQQAARVNGGGDDARSALEAVAEVLPREREQARLQKVLEKNAGRPPYELTTEIMRRQRAIAAESAAAQTSAPPQRIDKLEALAQRQRDNADLLGVLRLALESDNSTNVPPQLDMYFQALQEAMSQTRTRLRDLDQRAPEAADAAAGGVYNFWKEVARYPDALQEGLVRQTNANARVQALAKTDKSSRIDDVRDDQFETQILTELFLDRFTNAVPENTEPSSVPGGLPIYQEQSITPETRAEIIKLAQEAIECQKLALEALDKPDWSAVHSEQQKSRKLLQDIKDLLPQPPPPEQQQKQDKDQEQNQQQEQEQDQQKQDQQQSGGQQDQQEQQNQEQDQPQSDEQKEDQPQSEQEQPEQEQPEQEQSEEEQSEQEQSEQDQSEKEQPEPEQPEQGQSEPEQSEVEQQAAAEAAESDDKEEMTPEQAIRILQGAAEREKEYRRRQQRQYAPLSPTDRDW